MAAVALAAAIGSATSVYTVAQVAGHNPPFLLRSGSREIEQLRTGGMGIGLFPRCRIPAGLGGAECGRIAGRNDLILVLLKMG